MTIQTDINDFRDDNGISLSQLSDTKAIRFYNYSRDYLIDQIIKQKEGYFYDEQTTNLVQGQREYAFPKRGDIATDGVTILDGLISVKQISVKIKSTDTEYTELKFRSFGAENEGKPFCTILDNSWFLEPKPTENITNGAIIYGTFYPKKVSLTDTEKEIFDQYKNTIFIGVLAYYYKSIQKFQEYDLWNKTFEIECDRVASMLAGRIEGPLPIENPNLNEYS